jgi:hypothetical protein
VGHLSPSLPLLGLLLLGALPVSKSAAAQTGEASPAPAQAPADGPAGPAALEPSPLVKPKISVAIPEPAPAPERTVHRHDGFYTRLNLGILSGRTYVSTDRSTHADYSVGGGGLGLDLMVGGTPSGGLATGGALSLSGFGHASGSGGDYLLVGGFVDGFPSAARGLHFGGELGLALTQTSRKDDVDELRGAGLGMAVWLGHGFWVGDDWSLGGLLRFSGALTRGTNDSVPGDSVDLGGTTHSVALMFSVVYH